MNVSSSSNICKIDTEKILGRKIKRYKNSFTTNIGSMRRPPSLSQSTLTQIDKAIKKRKKKIENDIENINNFDSCANNGENISNFKLPQLSLKEQYEDLLNRKELILPPKYRILLKKQNYLDKILSENNINHNLNNNNNITGENKENTNNSYKNIQNSFNKNMNINFNNNDFQQILFVCPFYYIYQSIHRVSKGIEIKYIDIPNDYIQRMNKKYNLNTNFTLMQTPKQYEPFKGEINKAVMEKRIKLFKKILINITLEQHQKFLKENNFPNFDPIKSCTWHHNFDLKNVKDIGVYDLIENNIKEYKKLIIR
jgi:hypothetical protein